MRLLKDVPNDCTDFLHQSQQAAAFIMPFVITLPQVCLILHSSLLVVPLGIQAGQPQQRCMHQWPREGGCCQASGGVYIYIYIYIYIYMLIVHLTI